MRKQIVRSGSAKTGEPNYLTLLLYWLFIQCQRIAQEDPSFGGRRFSFNPEAFKSSPKHRPLPKGNTRRAIDLHEGDKIDEKALKALIGAAVALNSASAAERPGREHRRPR